MKVKKTIATLCCLTTEVIFGFSFLFSKTALQYTDTFVLVAVRFVVAFLLLNLLLLTGKFKLELKGKPIGKLLLLGLVQPVVYFICETIGIDKTSSAYSGVMLGLLPIAGIIFGKLFLNEQIAVKQYICVLLSVVGVFLTTVGGEVIISLAGTLFLLGAVVSAGLFAVISSSISKIFSPFERTYIMFLFASVVFTGMALVQVHGHIGDTIAGLVNMKFWLSVIYLSGVSSVIAFLLLNYSLNYLTVSTQTLLSNFCAVVSVLAGILIMHEQFSVWQLVGVAIILTSVFCVSR